jgi:hypothetical protein
MTFTYNLTSSDPVEAALARMRLELGDTTSGSGVTPDGSNLQDEELRIWLDTANGDPLAGAGLAAWGLARRWAIVADIQVGARRESLSQVSQRWADLALALEQRGQGGAFSVGWQRRDGYESGV